MASFGGHRSRGAAAMSDAEKKWALVVNNGQNYHFGFDVAVVGAKGVGKSEVVSALTGARTDRAMRLAISVAQAAGPVYLCGEVTEVAEDGLVDVETCTASVVVFVFNDAESLQYALQCCTLLAHIPLKLFVCNTESTSESAPPLVQPPAAHKSFVVNALLSIGVPALQRCITEGMWDRFPYPPEASLLPRHVRLGKLFTESPAFMHDLRQRLSDVQRVPVTLS